VFLGPDDFGAAGDGVTNDYAALTGGGSVHMLGAGVYYTGISTWAMPAGVWRSAATGRLQMLESGVSRAGPRNLAVITAAPVQNPGYSDNGQNTAFDADFNNVFLVGATRIAGAATLGQPSSGYQLNPPASQVYLNLINNGAGWNQSTGGNGGRTGAAQQYLRFTQAGGGDLMSIFCNGLVGGIKAGATSFLANSAGSCMAGQVFASANGVYLQAIGDINLNDNGYDVSGIGLVLNFTRTNGTGALGATWMGVRPQSKGSVAVDALYSGVGLTRIGMDFAGMTLQDLSGAPTKTAITLKAGQAIYGNASNVDATRYAAFTTPGTEYLDYETATGWNIVVGSTPILQASAAGVSATQLRITAPTVPVAANDNCTKGQIAYDTGYLYACTATNTWKRAALASW
jgi:hypothetical protein